MTLKKLDLSSIRDLDVGRVEKAFQIHLGRAVQDCEDRPSDDRARTITIQLQLKPLKEVIDDKYIECAGATGICKISSSIPDYQTSKLDFGVRKGGMLVFSEDSPGDHKQNTLAFDEDDSAADGPTSA